MSGDGIIQLFLPVLLQSHGVPTDQEVATFPRA